MQRLAEANLSPQPNKENGHVAEMDSAQNQRTRGEARKKEGAN
jgi:hypothetical protein